MSSGSIVLYGFIGPYALYLLDKTIGKTIEEAWLQSELHERFKDFLLTNLGHRNSHISQVIAKNLAAKNIPSVITANENEISINAQPEKSFEGDSETDMDSEDGAA